MGSCRVKILSDLKQQGQIFVPRENKVFCEEEEGGVGGWGEEVCTDGDILEEK